MMTRPCDALPPVRGTYTPRCAAEGSGLVPRRRSGGSAVPSRRCRRPRDLHGGQARRSARVSVIGVGSNLLVRDGGIPGVVVRLPAAFGKIDGRRHARARRRRGAGCAVARAAADAGIAGLEFLRGVPGTIGGALQDECRLLWQRDQGHFRRSHRHRRQGQYRHARPPTWASSIASARCRTI